jgi:hypothetical protein
LKGIKCFFKTIKENVLSLHRKKLYATFGKTHESVWKNFLRKSTLEVRLMPVNGSKKKAGHPCSTPSRSLLAMDYRDSIPD